MRNVALICVALSLGLAGCTEQKTEEQKTKTKTRGPTDRKGGNFYPDESAAIGALKTITNSQALFREGDKEGDSNEDYGTLKELADQHLIDDVLGSGTKQGFVFEVSYHPETSEYLWWATARPEEPSDDDVWFATNHEGVVYYSTKGPVKLTKDCQIVPADGVLSAGRDKPPPKLEPSDDDDAKTGEPRKTGRSDKTEKKS